MRVAVWSGGGIGGTEKAAVAFAAGLAERGYAVDFLGEEGPRSGDLIQRGIRVIDAIRNPGRLPKYLRTEMPDIVHQHVPGTPMPANKLYEVWPSLPEPKPLLIETNVFGRLEDPGSMPFVAFRMFVSLTSAVQAFRRAGRPLDAPALETHTVLFNPVEPHEPVSPARRAQIKGELGISEYELLAIRLGQVSPKWRDWECQAFRKARRSCSKLRLLLMEPPEHLALRISRGEFGPGIIVRKATSDFKWLRELYRSADLMVHATDTGESFGYTLAEAMASGLPLIVRTTPWGDNAQVELVSNGVNGFVCASVGEIARRWVELATKPGRRQSMGDASLRRGLSFAKLEDELNVLEDVIRKVKTGAIGPSLRSRNEMLLSFSRQFSELEWKVSEKAARHPLDYLSARVYSFYRVMRTTFRSGAGRMVSRVRSTTEIH